MEKIIYKNISLTDGIQIEKKNITDDIINEKSSSFDINLIEQIYNQLNKEDINFIKENCKKNKVFSKFINLSIKLKIPLFYQENNIWFVKSRDNLIEIMSKYKRNFYKKYAINILQNITDNLDDNLIFHNITTDYIHIYKLNYYFDQYYDILINIYKTDDDIKNLCNYKYNLFLEKKNKTFLDISRSEINYKYNVGKLILNNIKKDSHTLDNPIIDNPIIDNPIIDNPILDNSIIDNPIIDNPIIDNSIIDNPIIDNSIIDNPIIYNLKIDNPIIDNNIIDNNKVDNNKVDNNKVDNNIIDNNKVDNNIIDNNKVDNNKVDNYKVDNNKVDNYKVDNNKVDNYKIDNYKTDNIDVNIQSKRFNFLKNNIISISSSNSGDITEKNLSKYIDYTSNEKKNDIKEHTNSSESKNKTNISNNLFSKEKIININLKYKTPYIAEYSNYS